MQSPSALKRITSIDGYRGLAILAVMFHHAMWSPGFPDWLRPLFQFIPPGVTSFWVLSGFLITRSLLRDEQKRGAIQIPSFYARQGIRYFVPLVIYVVVIGLFIAFRFPGTDWRSVLHPLLLDPNTYCVAEGISHLYSLVLQIYFWLAWPIILKTAPSRHRLSLAICLCLVAFVWRGYGQQLAFRDGTCAGRIDYFFGSLLLGSCFALAEINLKKVATARFSWPISLTLFLSSLLIGLTGVFGYFTAFFYAFPWAMIVFALSNRLLPTLDRILNFPVLTWLGRISLSVYLWQNVFCFGLSESFLDRFPLNIPASIVLGYVAYRLIELPSLRWRSKIKPRSALSPLIAPELLET